MGKMFAQLFHSFEIMFKAWEIIMTLILDLATWGGGKAKTARIEGELEDAEAIDVLKDRIAARKAAQLVTGDVPAIAP